MHEKRGCSRRRQRRCDLVAYVAGLSHAADNDAAGRRETQLASGGKIVIEAIAQGKHSACLYREDIAGERE
jgi:hypothetical protein